MEDADEPDDERTPWWRYALAGTLGLSILGLTYVLFDPDLGTEAPLFGEFTCRGKLAIEVANGFHEPYLVPPDSAVYFRTANAQNETVATLVTVQTREGSEAEWATLLTRTAPEGDGFVFIPQVTNDTQARVLAKDLAGAVCPGTSRTITTEASPAAADARP